MFNSILFSTKHWLEALLKHSLYLQSALKYFNIDSGKMCAWAAMTQKHLVKEATHAVRVALKPRVQFLPTISKHTFLFNDILQISGFSERQDIKVFHSFINREVYGS